MSEGTDFAFTGAIFPECADLLRTQGSRAVAKLTAVTLDQGREGGGERVMLHIYT